MKIKKFVHTESGKTIYAVIGESNAENAMEEVYRYKKANRADFFNTHNLYTGIIKNNKLYFMNNIDVNNDKFGKGISPCYIIARNTLDLSNYLEVDA